MCAAPTLTLTIRGPSATSRIVADGPSVTIGRGADCTVVLADTRRAISRLQARIEWRGGHYVLTDSGSNPTLVNGHILTVSHQAVLRDADALSIGEYLIELGIDGPPASDDATVLAICRACTGPREQAMSRSRRRGTAATTGGGRGSDATRRPGRPTRH
jgi:type VI secretion system protein